VGVRGSKPGGARFSGPIQTSSRVPHNLVCNGHRVFFFPGIRWSARVANHKPLFSDGPRTDTVVLLRFFCASLACKGTAFYVAANEQPVFNRQHTAHRCAAFLHRGVAQTGWRLGYGPGDDLRFDKRRWGRVPAWSLVKAFPIIRPYDDVQILVVYLFSESVFASH
jgi:hypothetical protein